MKDSRQYEHYVINGLLIVVIILIVYLISSQNHRARYQVHYVSAGLVFIFDPATGHLWSRYLLGSRKDHVTDWGTMENPRETTIKSLHLEPTEAPRLRT